MLQPISSSGDGRDGKQGGVSKRYSKDKTLKYTLPVLKWTPDTPIRTFDTDPQLPPVHLTIKT